MLRPYNVELPIADKLTIRFQRIKIKGILASVALARTTE
jgi:hypothetical protein